MNPTPEQIIKLRALPIDKKQDWVFRLCENSGVSYRKTLELIPSVFFHTPTHPLVPLHNGKRGEGYYSSYPVEVAGHDIQLTWSIHEVSAGDCSVPGPRHGILALNEYAMAALVAKLLPDFYSQLQGNDIETKTNNKTVNSWEFFTKGEN